jgi:hypothetical protein
MFQAMLSIPAKRMNTPRSWYHEAWWIQEYY